jgi:hypothetical protein
MTIEVTQTAPAIVTSTKVTLPFYFTAGTYTKQYCCMTAERVLISVTCSSYAKHIETRQYDDLDEVSNRLAIEMRDKLYAPIDEAIFHHKFSEAHRELFYTLNPDLKPKI